jgi:nitrogen regulatory protein PII 2
MKEVMAIIRMNKINQTKRALIEAGISSMHARDCLGRGTGLVDVQLLKGAEQGYEEAISQLGNTQRLIPKRMISIVVPDNLAEKPYRSSSPPTKRENPATAKYLSCPYPTPSASGPASGETTHWMKHKKGDKPCLRIATSSHGMMQPWLRKSGNSSSRNIRQRWPANGRNRLL